ncbi:MAG: transporter substrate-binding domain-containing protein [Cyanobacteria bacterium P01_F01_bin.150]
MTTHLSKRLPKLVPTILMLVITLFTGSLVAGIVWQPPAFATSLPLDETVSTLKVGSEGTDVKALQLRLKTLGYFELDVDGVYDETTETAVRSFQRDRDLVADGIASAKTQEELVVPGTAQNSRRAERPFDIQRILDRGKLVVAVLGKDNPPFFMEDGDSQDLQGLDIKIAQGLADTLGVDLEFNRTPKTFNEVVDQVYQLNADLAISKLSRTLPRAMRVKFSRPYVTMRQGLLVNRLQLAEQTEGNRVIDAIRNFSGKVGVISGSSYVGFLKQKFPAASIEEYPAWDDIVDAVIKGEIQAAYRDELEVKEVVLRNPDASLRLQTVALTDTKDQIAMALPWDSSHLQALVNQYLDTFDLDYTADLVLEEYSDFLQTDK